MRIEKIRLNELTHQNCYKKAGPSAPVKQNDSGSAPKPEEAPQEIKKDSSPIDTALAAGQNNEGKTLKDAVKPKNRRKKRAPTNSGN